MTKIIIPNDAPIFNTGTKINIIDLSKLPNSPDYGHPCDFIIGNTNGGLTIYAHVGDCEEFGDTPQEALDAAIAAFNNKNPKPKRTEPTDEELKEFRKKYGNNISWD